jgi:hypothetical protein
MLVEQERNFEETLFMKGWQSFVYPLFLVLLFVTEIGCDKTPQVYTINSFWPALTDSTAIGGIKVLRINGLEGTWVGLGHQLQIQPDTLISGSNESGLIYRRGRTYTVQLIDIPENAPASKIDTTPCRILLIDMGGKPWVEVRTESKEQYDHTFFLEVSSILKLEKISTDTLILKMPAATFVEKWLKEHNYNSFTPEVFKDSEKYPLYITEPADRLAIIFSALAPIEKAFLLPDTLVRKN